jgi:hypothetical protein
VTHGHSAEEEVDRTEEDHREEDHRAEADDRGTESRGDAEAEVCGKVARRQEGGGDAKAEGYLAEADDRQEDDRAQEVDGAAQEDDRGSAAQETGHGTEVHQADDRQEDEREEEVAFRVRWLRGGGLDAPLPLVVERWEPT